MKILDLFCGAGGASMGYHNAGFEVTGVDISPQKNYPFGFIQDDALGYLEKHGHEFDVIHASPPCQKYSRLSSLTTKEYPKLIEITRRLLKKSGRPYVIENVKGAPFNKRSDLFGNHGVELCGSMFGLGVWRHRIFETSIPIEQPKCRHDLVPMPIDVTGTGGPCNNRTTKGGGIHRKPKNINHARRVMGIAWMIRRELSQAIPPAYTEYIGNIIRHKILRE